MRTNKVGTSAIVFFVLAALTLTIWLVVTITQIRTSEALVLGQGHIPIQVAWGVLLQPWELLSGTAPLNSTLAYCYAWIVEVTTLVYALALNHAVHKLKQTNASLGKLYAIAAGALIALNGWADYSSSPGTDPLIQGLIALGMALTVTTGLVIGIGLVERGIEEMRGA